MKNSKDNIKELYSSKFSNFGPKVPIDLWAEIEKDMSAMNSHIVFLNKKFLVKVGTIAASVFTAVAMTIVVDNTDFFQKLFEKNQTLPVYNQKGISITDIEIIDPPISEIKTQIVKKRPLKIKKEDTIVLTITEKIIYPPKVVETVKSFYTVKAKKIDLGELEQQDSPIQKEIFYKDPYADIKSKKTDETADKKHFYKKR